MLAGAIHHQAQADNRNQIARRVEAQRQRPSPAIDDVATGKRTDQIYPLITEWPHDKQDVNTFWEEQPFTLELKEYQGNCRWCWKKSDPKLVKMAKKDRAAFDVPAALERDFARCGPLFRKDPTAPSATIFRKHRSTLDLLNLADQWPDQFSIFEEPDKPGSCSESCEPFAEPEETDR